MHVFGVGLDDCGRLHRYVGRGFDGDDRPFPTVDVASRGCFLVELHVRRKDVMHVIESGARRLNDVDHIVARVRIAGHNSVRQALQQPAAVLAVEHSAKSRQILVDPSHLHRLVDVLVVGRRIENLRMIRIFAAHIGLDRHHSSGRHVGVVVRIHVADGRFGGDFDGCHGKQGPFHRRERIFRRPDDVPGRDDHNGQQRISHPQQGPVVDRFFNVDMRELDGSPLLHRLQDGRGRCGVREFHVDEIHQIALELRIRFFDDPRGIQRMHATQERKQHPPHQRPRHDGQHETEQHHA